MTLEEIKAECLNRQLDRVIANYPDFLEEKGFDKLPDFFRHHLYAVTNRQKRVNTIKSLRKKVAGVASSRVSENLDNLIMLSEITDYIEDKIATQVKTYVDSGETLDDSLIEKAIQQVGYPEVRKEQIVIMADSLVFFFQLTQLPFLKLMLTPIKVVCNVFGAQYIVETIEEGYNVAKEIEDISPFVEAFKERELQYIQSLFPEINIADIKVSIKEKHQLLLSEN